MAVDKTMNILEHKKRKISEHINKEISIEITQPGEKYTPSPMRYHLYVTMLLVLFFMLQVLKKMLNFFPS